MALPAWTYSQLDSFETCPKKFYHLKVVRDIVEPPTEATIWGSKVHEALEYRVKDGTPLPEGMTQWEALAAKICAMPGEKLTEQKMALDRNFQPAEWGAAWTRGIADLVVVGGKSVAVMDYKTGKRKPTEQLMLYAGYAFSHYPDIDQVLTGFVWLKERRIDKAVYQRDEVSNIWQHFLARSRKLESSYERDSWPPRPSGLCKGWCPVKTCEFNKGK